MKIVYCINNTWYSGGMTRVLTNKANYLVNHGHEVTIVTTDQIDHTPHYPLDHRVVTIDLGINYLGLDPLGFISKAIQTIRYLKRHKKRLRKLLSTINADVVISMFTKEMFVLPDMKDGSVKILEIHTSHYNWSYRRNMRGWIGKLQSWLDIRAVKKFDKFVVLTNEDKSYWEGVPNIVAIPNANTFEPEKSSSLLNKKVLAVGRHSYEKNFEDLLRAWKLVYDVQPEWGLKIVGNGVDGDDLRQLANDLGIGSAVSLQNSIQNIMDEYLSASIYVLSSRYEGLGMVLLEAQACGVPLVSYACKCGPGEIIVEGENGFLVEVNNVDELADRIIRLIEDEPLRMRMGRSAKEHSTRFSEKYIMDKWLKLFAGLKK